RCDAGAPHLTVRVPAVHRLLPLAERQGAPGVQELGPERQPADGYADRARLLVRHVLLPTRRRVLVAAEGPQAAAAEMGEDLRLRQLDGLGRRPGGARPRADDPLAAQPLHEAHRSVLLGGRPPLEARQLDPTRDRAGRPARDAAADDPLLRA